MSPSWVFPRSLSVGLYCCVGVAVVLACGSSCVHYRRCQLAVFCVEVFMRHIYKYSFIHSFVIIEKLLSSFIFSVKKYFQVWSSYSFLKVITVTEYVKSWNLTGLEDAILTWRMRYRPWGCNTDHEDAIQIMRMQNRPWECNTDHEDASSSAVPSVSGEPLC